MANCARTSLGWVNIFILFYSICYIFLVTAFKKNNPAQCFNYTYNLHLWLAIFMVVISAIGLFGMLCRSRSMQGIFAWVAVIATLVSIILVTFLTSKFPKETPLTFWNNTEKASGNWYEEYSPSLRNALVDDRRWHIVRKCLIDIDFCEYYKNQSIKDSKGDFFQKFQFPELGCCHAPNRCDLLHKNVTQISYKDTECLTWEMSVKTGSCYTCDSCKAGFIAKDHDQWMEKKEYYSLFLVFLVITTLLACYVYAETKYHD